MEMEDEMGDGQECNGCRHSRRNCICVPRYQVVATRLRGKSEVSNAYSRKDAEELLDWFIRKDKCSGGHINVWVEGIGYVLDEPT